MPNIDYLNNMPNSIIFRVNHTIQVHIFYTNIFLTFIQCRKKGIVISKIIIKLLNQFTINKPKHYSSKNGKFSPIYEYLKMNNTYYIFKICLFKYCINCILYKMHRKK